MVFTSQNRPSRAWKKISKVVALVKNPEPLKSPTRNARFTRQKTGSKRFDAPNLSLVYKRARYYVPTTAEFTSKDPLEYVDGMSLFRGYFAPRLVDPWGMDTYEDDLFEDPPGSGFCWVKIYEQKFWFKSAADRIVSTKRVPCPVTLPDGSVTTIHSLPISDLVPVFDLFLDDPGAKVGPTDFAIGLENIVEAYIDGLKEFCEADNPCRDYYEQVVEAMKEAKGGNCDPCRDLQSIGGGGNNAQKCAELLGKNNTVPQDEFNKFTENVRAGCLRVCSNN